MRTIFTTIAAGALLTAVVTAQAPSYRVIDLGTLPGGTFSQATSVNNRGVVTGIATRADGTQHSVVWYLCLGLMTDIAKGAPAAQNSGIFGINDRGEGLVQAEASTKDPNKENFCGYGTGLNCLPFVWQGGVATALPLPGGNNGTVGGINNKGEAAGIAETATRDPQCPATPAVNGTGPQVLGYEAVIWGPGPADIRKLPLLAGDTVGMALWINDNSQAVGTSGTCANSVLPPLVVAPHAVLWEKDGTVTDLGDLGGTANTEVPGLGNVAFGINNSGQVTGISALPGSATGHAFLWNRGTGMRDLGILSGDVMSAGLGLNDLGAIVGASQDDSGSPRAFLWQNGTMTELNTISPGSPLYLLLANGINANGVIVGFGATKTGDLHGFAAIPSPVAPAARDIPAGPMVLTEAARKTIRERLPFGKRAPKN